jgi:hypothetical protein
MNTADVIRPLPDCPIIPQHAATTLQTTVIKIIIKILAVKK